MSDLISDIIDDLDYKDKNKDVVTPLISDNYSNPFRKYWVEILLTLICIFYLYYVSSSVTILGFSIGRFIMQSFMFILPFIGLWLFYYVNKYRQNREDTNKKKLRLAVKQKWKCNKCNTTLGNTYFLDSANKNTIVCNSCFDKNSLNNSLYKTLKDF